MVTPLLFQFVRVLCSSSRYPPSLSQKEEKNTQNRCSTVEPAPTFYPARALQHKAQPITLPARGSNKAGAKRTPRAVASTAATTMVWYGMIEAVITGLAWPAAFHVCGSNLIDAERDIELANLEPVLLDDTVAHLLQRPGTDRIDLTPHVE